MFKSLLTSVRDCHWGRHLSLVANSKARREAQLSPLASRILLTTVFSKIVG
jgi:hypothetical protein